MDKVSIWKGKDMESFQMTPARRRIIYNQNLLVQLLHLDNDPLFLAIEAADNELDLEHLRSLYTGSGYLPDSGETDKILSSALDTLLDFAIFRAEWRFYEGEYSRVFVNRNELFDMFSGLQDKLTLKLSELNFLQLSEELRDKIHIGEDSTLYFDSGYYLNRIDGIEKELVKFIEEYLLKPKAFDVLIPLARKGWVIFDHLKEEYKFDLNVQVEYRINPRRLANKRICVFDDAVKQGKHLCTALTQLLDGGIPAEKITLVTFLLNQTEYEDEKNIYREKIRSLLGGKRDITACHALDYLDFHRKVADIIMSIAHFGTIIDPDHLVVSMRLSEPLNGKDVIEILNGLGIGNVLEPGANLQHLYPGKKKITIDKIDYKAFTGETVPKTVKEISQCKIRMIWKYDPQTFQTQEFELTPIINPVIRTSVRGIDCKNTANFGFCQKFLDSAHDERLCVDCVLFDMVPKLLKAFLETFAEKMPKRIHIGEVTWLEFETDYRDNPLVMNTWEAFKNGLREKYA